MRSCASRSGPRAVKRIPGAGKSLRFHRVSTRVAASSRPDSSYLSPGLVWQRSRAGWNHAYGVYQNGSICHFHLYYLFEALYRSGLRKKANALWMKVTPRLRQGQPGISGPLHSGVDWTSPDGSPSGYEGLLAEQHHFLVAAVTGYLGYELTIDGLRYKGRDSAWSRTGCGSETNFARLAESPNN